MFGPLLDVQMSFRVAGVRDCAPCQKQARSKGLVAFPKTMAGVGHLKRIWKDVFRVAGAIQETCSSEMFGGQGADFLRDVEFGASDATLRYTTLHYATLTPLVTLHYTIQLHYFTLHYTATTTTVHYTAVHYATLITPHHNYNYNYTTLIALHYSYNLQLQLHYNYNCATPHYIQQLWVR